MLIALESLSFEDEVPTRQIPDEPLWTENYCYIAYDFETNVGLYLHIGRWLQDPSLWREQVYVYLPDGTTLNYRSIGARDCSKGPQGALVSYECVEAGELWKIDFDGPTNHFDRATSLARTPLPERVLEKMTLTSAHSGAGPVLMFQIPDNRSIGRWHYEQEMVVDAVIEHGGATYRMNRAQGWRDHTRGPRYLGNVLGHINMQGKLPDGRFFSAFQVWEDHDGEEVQIVDECRMIKDGVFSPCRIVEASRLMSPEQLDEPVRLVLDADGERIELVGEALNLLTYSCTPTFEILYGFAPEQAPFVCFNQPTRFRYRDGYVGGSVERTLRFGEPAPRS